MKQPPFLEFPKKVDFSVCFICTEDFVLSCAMLLTAKELGMYDIRDPENAEIYELAKVGNTDLLCKKEHGYMSYGLGHRKGIKHESDELGCFLIKQWWLENYAE